MTKVRGYFSTSEQVRLSGEKVQSVHDLLLWTIGLKYNSLNRGKLTRQVVLQI